MYNGQFQHIHYTNLNPLTKKLTKPHILTVSFLPNSPPKPSSTPFEIIAVVSEPTALLSSDLTPNFVATTTSIAFRDEEGDGDVEESVWLRISSIVR